MSTTAQGKIIMKTGYQTPVYGLGVSVYKNKVYLYFRTKKDHKDLFHVATSTDGFTFTREKPDLTIKAGKYTTAPFSVPAYFSVTKQKSHFLMMYAWDNGKHPMLEKAWSKDLLSWTYEGNMIPLARQGVIAPDYRFRKQYVLYTAEPSLTAYLSRDLIHWNKAPSPLHHNSVEPLDLTIDSIGTVLNTEKGLLVVYHAKENDDYTAHLLLLDPDDPTHVLWRANGPLWRAPKEWRDQDTYPIGIARINDMIIAYWQVGNSQDTHIIAVVYALHKVSDGHSSKDISLRLKKTDRNPILSPRSHNSWEAFNTFNPAAIYDEGKVHILYRAQGYDYVSVLGYAASSDGIHIDERLDTPVYTPSQEFEFPGEAKAVSHQYVSGGGFGGCEDPRITRIDDRFYLTYVAFDGFSPPRVALTSIAAADFLAKRWLWEKPVLISPPGIVDKSAVIFPEKINGKYVVMHRIYPDILIDFVDSLAFDGTFWLKNTHKISPRPGMWDSRKIGAGAPPIKTKYGWLLIYQSVGEQDPGRYKIGAMLLDLTDPAKVLHRSQSPILEPEEAYENDGFKSGVVYPCGAVVIGNTLYVYYGGADSYVCVATADLDEFLRELRFSEVARLTTPIMERIL